MKQLFRYIFLGALALIPLLVVVQMILWVNSISIELFDFVSSYTNSPLYTTVLFVVIIMILAFVGSSIEKAGKSFVISIIDRILEKVPAIGTVYTIIKKITELFTPNNKDVKKEVVLGASFSGTYEIINGIYENDNLITEGSKLVEPNALVKIIR